MGKWKKEQGAKKNEKGAKKKGKRSKGVKVKGAGSKGGKCERSREHGPPRPNRDSGLVSSLLKL